MSDEGLLKRITRETTRFAALQVVGAIFTWATTIVLSRLLDPRSFGVFAIGSFFLGLGALLGDGGLGATLLRKKESISDEEYRVTAGFLFVLGVALAVVFYVANPWIAARYHLLPAEARALRVMAPLFLAGPLRAVPYIRLERALRFGDIAWIELIALFGKQSAALAIAFVVGGPWALVGAQLTGMVLQLVIAYAVSPGIPRLAWRWSVLRSLLGYGLRVQGLSIAAYLKDNVSAALLGTLVGPGAVGLFNAGVNYAQIPVVAVNALARVQLPAYARFEAKDPALHRAVVAVTRTALVLGVAMLVVLAAGARAFIPWVLHERWLESVPVVWGLLVNMAGGLVAGPLFTLLQAQGKAGLALRSFGVWTVATWALVLVVRNEGLWAIAAAHSAVTAAMTLWLVGWAGRHLASTLWSAYVGPVVAGSSAVLASLAAERAGVAHGGMAALVALVTYVAVLLAMDGRRIREDAVALRGALRG